MVDIGRRIDAVETTMDVTEALQELDGAGVTELANHLDRSKSTIHAHLSTLVKLGYVVKVGKHYELSLIYLRIGEYVKNRIENYDVIDSEVTELAEQTGETAQFAVEERGKTVYVKKAYGEKGVQTASGIGKRLHMHSTALGKAMLAFMDDYRVDEIVDQWGLPRQTPNTIVERNELNDALDEIEERGYARDLEENVRGIRCVAAPIQSEADEVCGAVSVSGPAKRLTGDTYESELPDTVLRAANIIEVNSTFG